MKTNAQFDIIADLQARYGGVKTSATGLSDAIVAGQSANLYVVDGKVFCGKTDGSYNHQQIGLFVSVDLGLPLHTSHERAATEGGEPPKAANDNTPSAVRPKADVLVLKGTSALPQLEWVYGRVRIRKYVSALFSPGGGGKTSLLTAEALDMVTGRDLMAVGHTKKLRAWYINTEDPRELVERQFETAAALHRVSNDEIGGRLLFSSGRDSSFIVATEDKKTGFRINEPIVEGIIEVATDFKPDAIIVDPFVSTHEVNENDNGAIQRVATLWVSIADKLNCSIDLAHHVVKSDGPVTANSGRGGGALKDKARIVRVVNPMSEEQAKGWEVTLADRREYFSATVDKGNLSKVGDGGWYHIESVPLGNGRGLTKPSEHAPAAKRWYPPDASPEELAVGIIAELTGDDLAAILTGIENRQCRLDQQASDWAGHEIGYVLGVDTNGNKKDTEGKKAAGRYLRALIATGHLETFSQRDAVARRTVMYVRVAQK